MSQEAVPALPGPTGMGMGLPTLTKSGGRGSDHHVSNHKVNAPGSMLKGSNRAPGEKRWVASIFLFPAVVLLVVIVFYPLVYSLVRSLFTDVQRTGEYTGAAGHLSFVNYTNIFSNHQAFRSLKNNLIWVLIVPALVTMFGMIFAVLSERIRWVTAFKIIMFMPLAISLLATGISFSLIYSDNPSRGLANAITVDIHSAFSSGTTYPGVHASPVLDTTNSTKAIVTSKSYSPSTPVLVPLVGLSLTKPPSGLKQAVPATGTGLRGTVWNDFKLGGGGTPGQIAPGQLGLSGITVDAVQNGKTVASTTTGSGGTFDFSKLSTGTYQISLPNSNFAAAYDGISWLGSSLITPAIIIAYLWVYAGFAMVLIASGMAAIPRDALEAARMDGATEWQVFRRVTMPLLAPVLTVVFVTVVINVLKVFDIVYILSAPAPENGRTAQVLATQLYSDFGQQQFGGASAVGIVLVILVLPAMAFNVHRFRKEGR
jgi:alpha-glucoside transport system permease protein